MYWQFCFEDHIQSLSEEPLKSSERCLKTVSIMNRNLQRQLNGNNLQINFSIVQKNKNNRFPCHHIVHVVPTLFQNAHMMNTHVPGVSVLISNFVVFSVLQAPPGRPFDSKR